MNTPTRLMHSWCAGLLLLLIPAMRAEAQDRSAQSRENAAHQQILEATGIDFRPLQYPPAGVSARGLRVLAGLHRHETMLLPATMSGAPDTASFELVIDGERVRVGGVRHSMLADDFKLMLDRGHGRLEEVEPGPARTYRGLIVGEPQTQVRFTLKSRGICARIHRPGEVWHVEPVGEVRADGLVLHVVYRTVDVRPVEGTCGVTGEMAANDSPMPRASSGTHARNGPGEGGGYKTEIALDADYEFYEEWSSDARDVYEEAVNILNNVEAIYEDQVNISYILTRMIVRTSESDPYNSEDAFARLCEFNVLWSTVHAGIHRDLAHLLTGVNLDGTTIGLATVSGIRVNPETCQSDFGATDACPAGGKPHFGLSEEFDIDSLQAELVSHEIGHNWGACHCSETKCDPAWSGAPMSRCGIMTSFISTFSGDTTFSAFSVNQIVAMRDTIAACILDSCGGCCGDPLYADTVQQVIDAVASGACGSDIHIADGGYKAPMLLNRGVGGAVMLHAPFGAPVHLGGP